MTKKYTSAIILAAGRSSRMGFPKAYLPYAEGSTFVDKIIGTYKDFGCDRIVVVMPGNVLPPHPYDKQPGIAFVQNHYPERGRSYSLQLGMEALDINGYVFLQNIDNPFIHVALLRQLYASRKIHAIVKPVCRGKGGHPVLMGEAVAAVIRQQLQNNLNLRHLFAAFDQVKIPAGAEVLVNINTMAEYRQCFATHVTANGAFPPLYDPGHYSAIQETLFS